MVGCIDATHIKILKPVAFDTNYYMQKQVYMINLQAVCQENLLFTNAYIGFAGAACNSYVFQNSSLYLVRPDQIPQMYSRPDYHIIRDCMYPLTSYMLKPFADRGDLYVAKQMYNKSLSGCRQTIERAFVLLKGKWKVLSKIITQDLAKASLIVSACTVLHNFCLIHSDIDSLDEYIVEGMTDVTDPEQSVEMLEVSISNSETVVIDREFTSHWQGIGLKGKEKEVCILQVFSNLTDQKEKCTFSLMRNFVPKHFCVVNC